MAVAAPVTDPAAALKMPGADSIAAKVRAQLAGDYPPGALDWCSDLAWSGPTRVPMDQIDRSAGDWSAAEDKRKVAAFARRISAGWRKPAVAIRRPGTRFLYLVDGHTRAAACAQIGQPVTAWIGTASTAHGPWELAHAKQLSGDHGNVIEMVGPKGWSHGWVYHGPQAPGAKVFHPGIGNGTVTSHDGKSVRVKFSDGGERTFPARPGKSPARLEKHEPESAGRLANAAEMDRSRLSSMSGAQLKATDAEMSRRAALLGKPGQVSKTQKALRAEAARRDSKPDASRPERAAPAAKSLAGYKEWRDGLTPAEDKAMRFYQSPGFALMNGQLRGLDAGKLKASEHASENDLKRARQASRDLTKAIAKAPPLTHATTVYRGFDAAQFGKLEPGRVITDKGFTSTSITSDAGAVGRAGSRGQAEIILPAGTRAAAGSSRELVLPPGASFRVVSVRTAGGETRVKLELIQPVHAHANGGEAVELSAQTPALAVTPHPFGSPSGPGLFRVKGLSLPSYIQQIAHALLRTGRAEDESQAIQLAIGAVQRWARGQGKVSPEVRAASAAALAEWEKARATAHAHASDSPAVELAGAFSEALHPRVGAGFAAGGQFAPKAGAGQQSAARPSAGTRAHPAKTAATRGTALQHARPGSPRARQAAQLREKASDLRAQANIMDRQAAVLLKAHPGALAAAGKATATAKKAAAKKKNLPVKHKVKKATAKKKAAKPSVASRITSLRSNARALRVRARLLDLKARGILLAGDSPGLVRVNDRSVLEMAVKTPAPERAAGRRKLAAQGKALPGGSEPVPDLDYLRKAIRSVGRLDPSKRPALARLIRKRARELKAENAPGVKGTWPFASSKSMAGDAKGIELAMMMRRVPVVRGMADVQASRTGPSAVSVMHKSSGMKIGSIVPAASGGYQGVHADGTKTPASGSMGGAMAGLIAYHNKMAAQKASAASAPSGGIASVKGYANGEQQALDLAGALPHSTPASSSSDGPRVTSMGAGKKAKGAPGGMTDEIKVVYAKLIKKGMKPAQAMALAKRAAAMHAKAQAKAA